MRGCELAPLGRTASRASSRVWSPVVIQASTNGLASGAVAQPAVSASSNSAGHSSGQRLDITRAMLRSARR
jgi:hypothetical protein